MKYFYKNCFYPLFIFLMLLLLVEDISAQQPVRYKVIDLGTFGAESVAKGINSKGHVVGFSRVNGRSPWLAFIWRDSIMTDLGALSNNGASANAINDSDEVTGLSDTNPRPDGEDGFNYDRGAFFWKNNVMTDLLSLGGHASWANAINNSGVVVGESAVADSIRSQHAFSWSGGSMVKLEIDDNYRSAATGINNLGKIIGWKDTPDGNTAGWLLDGGLIDLGHLGGGSTVPHDINDQGDIVGRSRAANNQTHPFLWSNGVMIDLWEMQPHNWVEAYSINSSGQIVGGPPAFIYEHGQMKILNDLIDQSSGWILENATGINDKGDIVGYGIHDGNTRAFLLPGGLKVEKPKANDLWIAGEKDTIKWTGGKPDQFIQIDYSADSGRTFQVIDVVTKGDTGMYVWDIPGNILSKKCKIRIFDLADATTADTSDLFKIKPYILTRDSSGQYEPYRVEQDQWKFWNNQPDMFPPEWYQQFDYRGTDPFTGYSYLFAPYQLILSSASSFPDWVSWVRTFGIDACYLKTSYPPVYSYLAVFKWYAISGNWRGSCFGLAASNALAFSYKDQFQAKYSSFPGFANPITVASDTAVKRVVNELFTHQFGNPSRHLTSSNWSYISPNETLNELKAMFKEDNVSPRTLSFGNNNGTGGHNVLPYKLKQDFATKNIYYLFVYDNTFPSSTTIIRIDTLGNSNHGVWMPLYGRPDWGGPRKFMLMTESRDYLNDAALPKRTAGYTSPFILSSDELEIYTPLNVNTRIKDAQGNVTGYSNGSVLDEIPNSVPLFYLDGSETPPYGYSLPTANYSVNIDNFASDTVKTFFFTGDRTFFYQRADAKPNQTDRLYFDGGVSVVNPDQQTKTVSLLTIINETTQEKMAAFSSIELAPKDSIKIDNADSSKIRLISYGTAKDYDLELNYVTKDGVGRFSNVNIPLAANTSHTIVPDWTNVTNTDLVVLVDNGNNGTMDDTLEIENKTTGTGDDHGSLIPQEYRLAQNYPNPFNATTIIRFDVPRSSQVTIKIYDMLGHEVKTLIDRNFEAGFHTTTWDGKNNQQSSVASGVYFVRMLAENFVAMKKIVLLR